MTQTDLVGWSVTGTLIAGAFLRFVTWRAFWFFQHNAATGVLWRSIRWILTGYAIVVALIAIVGSLSPVYPGLWGPLVLVYAVVWQVIKDARPAKLEWFAPISHGLEDGERIVLLGGAAGTLIAYVGSLF